MYVGSFSTLVGLRVISSPTNKQVQCISSSAPSFKGFPSLPPPSLHSWRQTQVGTWWQGRPQVCRSRQKAMPAAITGISQGPQQSEQGCAADYTAKRSHARNDMGSYTGPQAEALHVGSTVASWHPLRKTGHRLGQSSSPSNQNVKAK